nr:MAG TPA: hypothetical protein [Caudoviricetes sp.]DAO71129.1 MAG TPA: hypothetical protein [Caudoviricetes sp.]
MQKRGKKGKVKEHRKPFGAKFVIREAAES